MEPTAATTLSQRVRRFLRWFFTVSPEAAADPVPMPRQNAARTRRQDAPSMRAHAQHAGRVQICERKRHE
jgi:hypothetical protein